MIRLMVASFEEILQKQVETQLARALVSGEVEEEVKLLFSLKMTNW